jgi:hypothetical protein
VIIEKTKNDKSRLQEKRTLYSVGGNVN